MEWQQADYGKVVMSPAGIAVRNREAIRDAQASRMALFARIMSRARVLAHSSGEYRDSETIVERGGFFQVKKLIFIP